jgi:uroporphyrinogen-III synthase
VSALAGKRIVITRAPHQTAEFEALLRERDAIPLLYPCIDIAPPADSQPLISALQSVDSFDWLILTSANTVLALKRLLSDLQQSTDTLQHLKIAAVGTATADSAAKLLNLQTDLIPDTFIAEALAEALQPIDGVRILLPQSAIAEPTLAETLRSAGARITVVDAYQTVIGSGGIDLSAMLTAGEIDVMTFTSSSTVRNLLGRLTSEGGPVDQLARVCLACIGSKTAATADKMGLHVAVTPEEYTIPGLIAALENYFSEVNHAHS